MAAMELRGRFLWYDLMTPDPDAAVAFYTAVVGWGTQKWDGAMPYTMWTAADAAIGGVMKLPDEAVAMGAPPHWLAYIGVSDVDAASRRTVELGGRVYREPWDIPEVGRIAVLADPQGATFAVYRPESWTPGHGGPARVGEFSWHELATTDAAGARSFYFDLAGWETRTEFDMGDGWLYHMYGRPGDAWDLGGIFNKPPKMPVPAWLYYARVPDLDAAVERVTDNGGSIANGPMEVPGGDRVAACIDPQGAMFALHQTVVR